jgi:glycine dehydrogenase subunit 1
MLKVIGVKSVEDLFASIPDAVKVKGELKLPPPMSEMALLDHIEKIARQNNGVNEYISFLGAGAYNHFIPSLVDSISSRGEFLTSYTPYQAEASQGTLQVIFEYQTMIAELCAMDISQASLYDGATALAEAVSLAHAESKKRRVILVSEGLHPEWLQTLSSYCTNLDVEIKQVPLDGGVTSHSVLKEMLNEEVFCLAFQSPNFFGCVEDGPALATMAHGAGAILIAAVNPISLGVLKPPGEYGADIAIGEGQSLGMPLSFGGPYLGFLAARGDFVRKMPGRIAGITNDVDGKRGFVLTYQTREQHIRREKATSNICTNQALCALRATVFLALLGKNGLPYLADLCMQKAHYAAEKITSLKGFSLRFKKPFFNEFAVTCPIPAAEVNAKLLRHDILGGFDCARLFPGEKNTLLVAVTERNTKENIDFFVEELGLLR